MTARTGKPNRRAAKAPKAGIFWCWGCDCQLIAETVKCPVCGTRNISTRKRRFTKKDNQPLEDTE